MNEQFAAAVAAEAPEGGTVLVQDYHLSLLGRMLAERRPDLATAHFHHTPFADPSTLRVLPGAAAGELLAGLAGFGACGFHTRRWAAAFEAAYADPGLAADAGGRSAPPTFVAPLGPDPAAIRAEAATDAVAQARAVLDEQVAGCRLIVRVDRIELSKNILRGLWALDELLEERPAWRGRVVMLALAYPSREGLAEYQAYRSEIEHTAELVNERWAVDGWRPVHLDVADDRDRSLAALGAYDVLLVNPVRDGMNLVAKEGPLVNTVDGVLVFSREAGAWEELSGAALGINPFDVTETAAALDRALAMAPEERRPGRPRSDGSSRAGRPGAGWTTSWRRPGGPASETGPTPPRSAPGRPASSRPAAAGQQRFRGRPPPRARRPPGRPRPAPRAGSRRRPRPPAAPGPPPRPGGRGRRRRPGRRGRHRSRPPGPTPAEPLHHRPLVGGHRGPELDGHPARLGRQSVSGCCPPGEVPGPALGRRLDPPVQGHAQPLVLDPHPAGPRPRASAATAATTGRQRSASGLATTGPSGRHLLHAVQAEQDEPGRATQRVGQEPGRAARDHGDQAEGPGQPAQECGDPGQRTGRRRVVDDGGQGAVVVEEQARSRPDGG